MSKDVSVNMGQKSLILVVGDAVFAPPVIVRRSGQPRQIPGRILDPVGLHKVFERSHSYVDVSV